MVEFDIEILVEVLFSKDLLRGLYVAYVSLFDLRDKEVVPDLCQGLP